MATHGLEQKRFRGNQMRLQSSGVSMARPQKKRWVAEVKTDSTHPPKGLFTKDASTIARTLASKKVSPKGPVSGMRMLMYFINRGGKGLSAARRRELEKAKGLLSKRIEQEKKRRVA
jgi:tRNA(adenine34) deaminase